MTRLVPLCLVLAALPAQAASVRSLVQEGNSAYERNEYDAALSAFYVTLSRDAFPFWTIMHVTLSWLPR